VEVCFALVLKTSGLEARAVTLYVFRISEHTGSAHVLFVLAPVLWPLCHIIKASGKLFALNPFNVLFAAATDNFNCFGSRVKHCHWHLLNQLNRCRFPNFLPEQARSGFWGAPHQPLFVGQRLQIILLSRLLRCGESQ
jgi:hypothetical protein